MRSADGWSTMTNRDRLQDEADITRVLHDYCRAIDRMDMPLLAECYWPDAHDDHGGFSGTAPEFIAWVRTLLLRQTMTQHVLSNIVIDIAEDRAVSESYVVAYHRGPADDARWNFVAGCRYSDVFERREGRWRIADRVTIIEWTVPLAAEDPIRDGRFGVPRAARDRTDPSYRVP